MTPSKELPDKPYSLIRKLRPGHSTFISSFFSDYKLVIWIRKLTFAFPKWAAARNTGETKKE